MKVVVDTNILFSAVLNTNSKIGKILLQPKSGITFFAPEVLMFEIKKHQNKLQKFTNNSNKEIDELVRLLTKRIKFIHFELIPAEILQKTEVMLQKIDIDDTEFVALTEYVKGRLWTGDKKLIRGLALHNWKRVITTNELHSISIF